MKCSCRNCGIVYDESRSRAVYKGYCSQACLHEKAASLGYRKPTKRPPHKVSRHPYEDVRRRNQTEYFFLERANAIGSVPVEDESNDG